MHKAREQLLAYNTKGVFIKVVHLETLFGAIREKEQPRCARRCEVFSAEAAGLGHYFVF